MLIEIFGQDVINKKERALCRKNYFHIIIKYLWIYSDCHQKYDKRNNIMTAHAILHKRVENLFTIPHYLLNTQQVYPFFIHFSHSFFLVNLPIQLSVNPSYALYRKRVTFISFLIAHPCLLQTNILSVFNSWLTYSLLLFRVCSAYFNKFNFSNFIYC